MFSQCFLVNKSAFRYIHVHVVLFGNCIILWTLPRLAPSADVFTISMCSTLLTFRMFTLTENLSEWSEVRQLGPVLNDLWTFRDLDFSRVVLSRPMIGPFATQYFSHLFDPSRSATSVIFAVCCQLTVNYSLTTSCIQAFLLISMSQFYFRAFKVTFRRF